VLYQIADIYTLKGDRKRAFKMLNMTLDYVGAEPGLLARLGTMHAESNDRDEALRCYLRSYEQLPNMDVLALLCSQYVNDERYETAAAFFLSAARMQPAEPKWLLMVASCHRRAQQIDTAMELYEQVCARLASAACLFCLTVLLDAHGYAAVA
jgi:intraflagellar transport protein 88